jgi:4'-phosphopantetheinyl transferase
MPVCYKIEKENFKLGLWRLDEASGQIFSMFANIATEKELLETEKFKNPARKAEWMASRLLLHELAGKLVHVEYNDDGKPFVAGNEFALSISHTKGMVAVIIAKTKAGIDIEMLSERVMAIQDKFIGQSEKTQLSIGSDIKTILLYWSAKETLYKIEGNRGIDFKKDLLIEPFQIGNHGEISGIVNLRDRIDKYHLYYFFYSPSGERTVYLIVYYFC